MLALSASHDSVEEFVQRTIQIEARGYHRFTQLAACLPALRALWQWEMLRAVNPECAICAAVSVLLGRVLRERSVFSSAPASHADAAAPVTPPPLHEQISSDVILVLDSPDVRAKLCQRPVDDLFVQCSLERTFSCAGCFLSAVRDLHKEICFVTDATVRLN